MEFGTDVLPDTLTVEHEGKPIPLREHPFVKEAPDLPTLIRSGFDAHREMGARVRIPGKDSKPEEMTAFKTKLVESGVLPAPIGKVEDYAIARPETLPDGISWDDKLAGELGQVLLKYQAPKELATALLELHQKALLGVRESLGTSHDAGVMALKKEHGDKYEERAAGAGRLANMIFKTDEEKAFYANLGLADHPGFLNVMMRLAPLAMQDSSFVAEMEKEVVGGASDASPEDIRSEVADIMNNKDNPKHAGYLKRDPEVLKYIDELYAKKYGRGTVEIGGGTMSAR